MPEVAHLCECGCGRETNLATRSQAAFGHVKGEPLRFIRGHRPRPTLRERFEDGYKVDAASGCWLWQRGIASTGYGKFHFTRANGDIDGGAHRASYEMFVGPIPSGFHVHHRCEVPACVNPAHLEALSGGEHSRLHNARQTHCKRGHEFTPENTYYAPKRPNDRHCRECGRLRKKGLI